MDWQALYAGGNTPWDMGRPHPELDRRLACGALSPGGTVLVPGCGYGHDALALAAAGWRVTAVDLVAGLAAQLQTKLEHHGGRFRVTDALALREPHDALFEHTFFCALPPDLRPAYGAMAEGCVRSGGHLHAVIFPLDKEPRDEGPPYQMTGRDLREALAGAFEPVEDAPIAPIETRAWSARWMTLRRR